MLVTRADARLRALGLAAPGNEPGGARGSDVSSDASAEPAPDAAPALTGCALADVGAASLPDDELESVHALYATLLAFFERRAPAHPPPGLGRDLSLCLDTLGDLDEAAGRFDEALAAYRRSLAIARTLADADAPPGARRDLAVSLENVAGACLRLDRLDEAELLYAEALAIARALAVESAYSNDMIQDLSVSLDRVAQPRPAPRPARSGARRV
jgi:tetratricopeptide (TPR) repeat protein